MGYMGWLFYCRIVYTKVWCFIAWAISGSAKEMQGKPQPPFPSAPVGVWVCVGSGVWGVMRGGDLVHTVQGGVIHR